MNWVPFNPKSANLPIRRPLLFFVPGTRRDNGCTVMGHIDVEVGGKWRVVLPGVLPGATGPSHYADCLPADFATPWDAVTQPRPDDGVPERAPPVSHAEVRREIATSIAYRIRRMIGVVHLAQGPEAESLAEDELAAVLERAIR